MGAPQSDAWLRLARGDIVLTVADEVVTYVARNLEPYRGFHCFMRALPELLERRPRLHAVVVGADGISYGDLPPYGGSYREMLLAELGDRLDLSRVHFLGHVPRQKPHLNVLQVSTVHVHFTYPFVLSWSILESMAAGCLVLGADNPPVTEVLFDGENGLTVDMFSSAAICARIGEVLDHDDRMQTLRDAARADVVRKYDLHTRILPQWEGLLAAVATGNTDRVVAREAL